MTDKYTDFWEDFGKKKSGGYYKNKFVPKSRIGLTNYLREKYALSFIPVKKSMVGVDVGCASGKQVFELAPKSKFVHGVDIAKSFVDYAKDKAKKDKVKNVDFKVAASEKLPYKKDMFDYMLISEVLEHVTGLEESLKEIRRVIKKGGYVLITVPNINADATLWGRLLRLLRIREFTPFTEFTYEGFVAHKDTHVREFTVDQLLDVCKEHDLTPQKYTTVSFIDFSDLAIGVLLKFSFFRWLFVKIEIFLSNRGWRFGRHIILLCKNTKKK